jgi:hypothetical protein
MTLNYDNLLSETLKKSSRLLEAYNAEIKKDSINDKSGMHTVFDIVFVPLLVDAIKNSDKMLVDRLVRIIEDMEQSEDILVQEVSGFTIIEALCDEFNDNILNNVLLPESRRTMQKIRAYIPGSNNDEPVIVE